MDNFVVIVWSFFLFVLGLLIFMLFKGKVKSSSNDENFISEYRKKDLRQLVREGRNFHGKEVNKAEKLYLLKEIEELIEEGGCPHTIVFELADFNSNHHLWERYLKNVNAEKRRQNKDEKVKELLKKGFISKYGADKYYSAKIKGELFEDMEEDLLLDVKGKPAKKESNLIKGKKTEIWYYENFITRMNTVSYRFSVRLVEGKVKGWKNL